MYTSAKNAQIVIALLKKHNIKHIVISPGGTNIPIVQGVQQDSFFSCYSVIDERSAMYFAIGLYLQLGVPIATSCTSAQATRNYIPGLTEAFYKHVPILAITTSKHPRYTYQEYMQAPDQTSLPKDAIKNSYSLPYISNEDDFLFCERLVNEAILEITHRIKGPVQLNIPIINSERVIFNAENLPDVKKITRYYQWEDWNVNLTNKKIMVVIGEHRPFEEKQISIIEQFVESHNAFIYTNHLSNCHNKYAISVNLRLAAMSSTTFLEEYKPDILVTIGGTTGDYPLYSKLSDGTKNDFEHWRISEDGNVVDTYDKLTKIFECPIETFFTRLKNGNNTTSYSYFKKWKELEESQIRSIDLPLSNLYLAQQLHKLIPPESYINFAILNSLRSWSFFNLDPSIICFSNVAAFGTDGCMSVLLGQSVVTDKLCFLITGDLAFFYDMNSLGIRELKNNIRILLINNGCGTEFKLHKIDTDTSPYISAEGHNNNAKGWAESIGFKYYSAHNKRDFQEIKNAFTKESDQSIILEIFTKSYDESNALKTIIKSNREQSINKRIKNKILSIVKG